MKSIEESGIIFEYDERTCECIKFDDHIAYKKVDQILKPTKGVDFIYIFDRNRLVFVEVKNLKKHTNDPQSREKLNADAESLMNQIAIKVRDSIACGMSAARFSTNDTSFWQLFNEVFLNENRPIIVIAWIEFDAADTKEKKAKMAIWGSKLKQKLRWIHGVRTSVNSVESPPPVNLNVRFKTNS